MAVEKRTKRMRIRSDWTRGESAKRATMNRRAQRDVKRRVRSGRGV